MSKFISRAIFTLPTFFIALTSFAQIGPMGGCVVTFNIGNEVTICSSSSIFILPEGSPAGGTYSGPGIMDDFFFPSIAGPGEHIITYAYDNGFCIGTASDTINVVLPIPIEVSGDMELCYGESTTITALNGEDIEWESGSLATSETFTPAETSYYIVSGSDENGCLTAGDFSIVVHPLPDIVFEGDTSICIGESTMILASGASSYVWSSGDETDFITISPEVESVYGIVATSEFGCVSESEVIVTVHEYPEVEILGETEICAFEPTLLFVTGNDSYEWNTGAQSASIEISPESSSTYSVVASNVHGCETTDEFELLVNPLPEITIEGDAIMCNGSTALLIASGASTYFWIDGGFSSDFFLVTPEVSGSYTVAGTDDNGCVGMNSFFIELYPVINPEVELLTTGMICTGDTIQLTMPDFTDVQWSFDGLTWPAADTLTWVVESELVQVDFIGSDINGCLSSIGTFTYEANPAPVFTVTGDSEVCAGDVALLLADGAESYVWSNGSEMNPIGVVLFETDTIVVSGIAENGCTAELSFVVLVNDPPVITIDGDNTICEGQSTTLFATGASSYVWSTGSDQSQIELTPTANETIFVQGTSELGCEGVGTIELVVDSIPVVTTDEYPVVCPGASLLLTAFGAENYVWSTGSQMATSEIAPLMTTEYSVIGTDGNGCSDTTYVNIEVFESIEFTIVLESDTVCDLFEPVALSVSPAGGVFSGEWVTGDFFTPSVDAWGDNEIVYSFMDENECYSDTTFAIFVDDCTSIDEASMLTVYVFPNPGSEYIYLRSNQIIQLAQIFDLNGKLVKTFQAMRANTSHLNVSEIDAGCYMILVQHTDGSVITQRWMKD